MAEYIEREAALAAAKKSYLYFGIKPIINSLPAIDVRPVVRGKWEPVHRYKDNAVVGWGCSVCGFEIDISEDGFNYCPKCGADMRECET